MNVDVKELTNFIKNSLEENETKYRYYRCNRDSDEVYECIGYEEAMEDVLDYLEDLKL